MDTLYHHAFQWLISEAAITSQQDLKQGAEIVTSAAKKYPMYYHPSPPTKQQEIETGIFKAEVLATYMQGRCGTNQLAIYQQDVIRRLMQLRTSSLEMPERDRS